MRLGGILLCLLTILNNNFLSAQHPCEDLGITDTLGFITDINVPDDGILHPGDDFCIDFSVENFDFVIGFQFTLSFDPSVMQYTFNTATPGVLVGPLSINDAQADNGAISILWTNFNAEGQNLPDGTQIFTICFQAIGEPNDCSDLYFNEFYPFFPELEVSHQIMDGEPCTFNSILLNGESSTQVKLECDEFTIIDVSACSATTMTGGSLSFSACGGFLPYNYVVTNSFNPAIMFNGTINTDGQEVSFTNIPAAVYTITITDAMGNVVMRNINIENGDPLDFDNILRPPSCSNFENGTIVIENISGGTPGLNGYTIEGSNGQFIANTFADSLIRLSNGDYTITVTDDSGCEVEETYTLLTDEIMPNLELDTASCFNAEDGFLRITPTGGVPFPGGEYLFVGTGMATSYETMMPFQESYFSSLTETFNIRIRDANGCELVLNIPIPTKSEIDAEFTSVEDVICKGEDTGSIHVTVNTAGRYLFLLTDDMGDFVTAPGSVIGNNQLVYNQTLPAGTYFLQITESTVGCELDTMFTIGEPAEDLIVTGDTMEPDCNSNNGFAFVEATGGVPPYSYEWAANPTIDNDTLYNLFAGIYDVTVTDDVGCSREISLEVMQGEVLEIDIDIINDLSCDGTGQGELEAVIINSSQSDFNYEWMDDSGMVISTDPTLIFSNPGFYYLEVSDLTMTCVAFDTVFFDPAALVSFDINFENPSCVGIADGSIEITNIQGGVAPYTCNWDDPTILDCMAGSLLAGFYNITISDASGCSIDTFVTLSDTSSDITFDVDAMDPSCEDAIDGSISFLNFNGGTAPYDCMWGDDPNVIGCPRTGLPAGSYPVTITDASGCQKDTVIVLTDPDPIEIIVDESSIVGASCFGGDDGQAEVTISVNPSGATDFNFSWSNPNDDSSGGLSDQASQLSPGLNFVYAFDNNSCASDTFFFNVPEPDMISLDMSSTVLTDPLCKGDCNGTADLQSSGGTSASGTYNYIWEDGFMGSSRSDLCAGMYNITIVDDNNCEQIESIVISEPDTLTLEIDLNGTVGLNCFGDNSGQIQVTANGGCGGYTYQWTNSVSTTEVATNLDEGRYDITVTDACGCTDVASYELIASNPITAQLIEPEIPGCFGATTCIGVESASGGEPGNYTYSVNFGNRIPIDSCVDVIAGVYTISVFDAVGCSEMYTLTVDQPEPLSVDLGPNIELDLGDNTAILEAEIESNSPIDSIVWTSVGTFACVSDNCQSVSIMASEFTTYQVTVYDENGCSASDQIEVTVTANRNVFLPNTFSPNNFPPNDKFMILTGEGVVEVVSFRIYDRWGNLVFEKENIPSPTSNDDGWNGLMNNRDAEQGVYVYFAEVRFVDDKVIKYSGDITLLR